MRLKNLQLKLDVLERELNLPVQFLSGKIHELVIHIPWTSLGSEPIVVTVNTVECVIAPQFHKRRRSMPASEGGEAPGATADKGTGEVPRYMQGFVSRLKNNITLQVNNLIFKYIQDDIVFSINVKKVESYSTDADWKAAFAEVASPNFLLHKLVHVTDATMCLDSKGPSGKVEVYQQPLLYRSCFEIRLRFTFSSQSAILPKLTQVHIRMLSFDLSVSDDQLAMLALLVDSVVGFGASVLSCSEAVESDVNIVQQRPHDVSEKATVELEPGDGPVRM